MPFTWTSESEKTILLKAMGKQVSFDKTSPFCAEVAASLGGGVTQNAVRYMLLCLEHFSSSFEVFTTCFCFHFTFAFDSRFAPILLSVLGYSAFTRVYSRPRHASQREQASLIQVDTRIRATYPLDCLEECGVPTQPSILH